MSVQVSDMVTRVRRVLNDNPYTDVTATALATTGATTFDVANGDLYDAGVVLEFLDDGEQVKVVSVSTNTLTVVRGWNDTDATTHAVGHTFVRDAVFQRYQILEAIRDSILPLWPYVWKQVESDDGGNIIITPSANTRWYELPEACLALSQVVQLVGDTNPWPFMYGTHYNTYPVSIRRNLPTSLVSTGVGLYLPYRYNNTNDIEVTAIGKITDDIEDDSGDAYIDLEEGSLAEAVVDYAVSRLLMGTDISRSTQEDVTMGDQTVVPGRRSQLADAWAHKGDMKRNDYQAELRDTLPRMEDHGRYQNITMRPRRP